MGWVIRLLRQPELALYWQMLQLPKVIGHRGAAAYAPENTLASFREARRRGATWVETDVKLTADGVPIVMHDNSLKRTTGIDRLVAETPRAELPAEVPTFEEAIACFGELGLGCNVEIKPCEGREAETARVSGRDAAPLLAGPSAGAVAVELQGRLARGRPRGRAGIRAGAADRRAGRRLARPRRGGRRRRASTPTARGSPRPRAVEIKRAGYALGVYTIDDRRRGRALVGMGVELHHHRRARRDPGGAGLTERSVKLRGCVLCTVLMDCHQTEIKQTHRSLAARRYIAGDFREVIRVMSRILLSSVAAVGRAGERARRRRRRPRSSGGTPWAATWARWSTSSPTGFNKSPDRIQGQCRSTRAPTPRP